MNFSQGWIVLILLGVSALSWIFGKLKEKAEAEEAKKRAQLQQQHTQRQSGGGSLQSTVGDSRIPIEQPATLRKQQLAQLRQERLSALRAEMASRLQTSSPRAASRPARQTTPSRRQTTPRPVAGLAQQPQQTRTNVATMRKPPSVSHDRAKLVDLGTHTAHAEHETGDRGVHRLVTDAPSTRFEIKHTRVLGVEKFTAQDWRRAIILSELLAPPVSLRGQA